MRFDDEDFTIVGVMPPNFEFPKTAEVWTPYALTPEQKKSRIAHTVIGVGRLRPGVTLAAARSEAAGLGRLATRYPDTNKDRRFKSSRCTNL